MSFAGLLAAGCGEPGPLSSVSFRVLGPPGLLPDGTCPETSTAQPPLFTGGQPQSVRVTYLRPGTDGTGELLCDVIVPYAGESDPIVAVPADSGTVTMAVEFFSADDELLAAGVARDIALGPGAGDTVDIVAHPSRHFSCARDRMQVPRAFHTATRLPDGKVLLIGGAVAGAADTDQVDLATGLFASAAIELYEPALGRFTLLSVPGGLTPRAMHETHIVDVAADGKVTLALLGGLAVSEDALAAPVLVPNVDGMRLGMGPMATGAPVELVVYDPVTSTVAPLPIAGAPPATPSPFASYTSADSTGDAPLVRAGGLVRMTDPVSGAVVVTGSNELGVLQQTSWQADPIGVMTTGRLGATVSALGNGSVLVWGGQIGALPADQVALAGEIVTGLQAGGALASMQVVAAAGSDAATPRAFHKAVAIAPGELLMLGGFNLVDRTAPAGVYAQHVGLDGGMFFVRTVVLGSGEAPPPAAYAGASVLESGDVLVTGGNPALGAAGCPATGTGQECSVDAAYVYRKQLGYLDSTAGNLLISRYGHGQTLLDDGTVLVTGGLRAAAGAGNLALVRDAELFAAWGLDGDTLAPALTRTPGQVATDAAGEPLRPCELIESAAPAQ